MRARATRNGGLLHRILHRFCCHLKILWGHPEVMLVRHGGTVANPLASDNIAIYTETIRLDPNNVSAYQQRSREYYRKGEYDKAIKDCTEAIRLDPNDAWAYHNRGMAYSKKGDLQKAKADWDKAKSLASVYAKKGVYDKAIKAYAKAIRLDPDDALAYQMRGFTYYMKDEFDKSIEDFTQAIRLKPDYVRAYRNRGFTYYKKSDYDKAIEDYTQVIRLNSNDAWAYHNRGMAYFKKGDRLRAKADYDKAKAMELDP